VTEAPSTTLRLWNLKTALSQRTGISVHVAPQEFKNDMKKKGGRGGDGLFDA